MAKTGLSNITFALFTEDTDGAVTYTEKFSPGKAISANVSVTSASGKLYADDGLAESDTSFSGGTVTINVDRDDFVTQGKLLGHAVTTMNVTDITRNADDIAPYVAMARVVTMIQDGKKFYKVEVICKVKFSEPNQEDNTRGENVEFGTITLEGEISKLSNGDWSKAHICSSKEAAIEYINTLFKTDK